jgi:hypothetical protein
MDIAKSKEYVWARNWIYGKIPWIVQCTDTARNGAIYIIQRS